MQTDAGFRPFTTNHAFVVIAFVGLVIALCSIGRRVRGTSAEPRLRFSLGITALVIWGWSQVHWLQPRLFVWSESLGLHVCDLGGLVAAAAFLSNHRWLRSLLYFWGIVLCTQAFVTPIVTEGPDTVRFWLFWLSHAAIVGLAIFDFVAGGFAPTFVDLIVSILITAAYVAAMFVLDFLTGWNYGYVGNVPSDTPTLLDHLGPWPWRVLVQVALGVIGFTLAWIPWEIARRLRGSPASMSE